MESDRNLEQYLFFDRALPAASRFPIIHVENRLNPFDSVVVLPSLTGKFALIARSAFSPFLQGEVAFLEIFLHGRVCPSGLLLSSPFFVPRGQFPTSNHRYFFQFTSQPNHRSSSLTVEHAFRTRFDPSLTCCLESKREKRKRGEG